MELFAYKVKNNVEPESKPRVYFTCHPADFARSFEKISEDILKTHDCILYYTPDMTSAIPEEDRQTTLERMNLFVIPVTFRLLREPNRAMDADFPWALEKKIPVLPIVIEPGLDEFYSRPDKFGALQYLDAYAHDGTAIRYEEKLEKFLQSVLVDEETAQRICAAFDAYIFLSYRQKDRAQANELMRMIHRNPLCRDIAIWYDEFLTPGREFTEGIQQALEKSELFALLVTQNLLEPGNYVQRIEYPEAVRAGKEILPVDMENVGDERLRASFAGVPVSVDGGQEDVFQKRLLETVRRLGLSKAEHDPAHNYLIGLAYLNGIDVEADRECAVELITAAAEAELPEAMDKLYNMYRDAVGVKRDYRQAVKWAERLAEYCIREYGEENPNTLAALGNLGEVYEKVGDYEQSAQWNEKVYGLRCKVLGEEHPDTITALGNLAVTYGELGDSKKSLELGEKVYALRCKTLGEEHPSAITALSNLAVAYGNFGDSKKSLELEKKAYALRCRVQGEEHPGTLTTLNNLASDYHDLGEYEKALGLKEKAYALFCKVLGEEHPKTLTSLNNLALTHGELGDSKRALELGEKAYALRCRVLGEEHPDTLTSLNNLAVTHDELGERERALELGEKAYALRCKVLGEEHPKTLASLDNLARIYGKTGQWQKAIGLREKSYSLRCKTQGEEHPDALASLGALAWVYEELGDYEKAAALNARRYDLCCKVLGAEAEKTLLAMNNLAYDLMKTGHYEKAAELEEKLYPIFCRLEGADSPKAQKHRDRLAEVYEKLGR